MVSNMKVEYYPLWIKENPELFETHKTKFLTEAKEYGLNTLKEYWKFGLFYMEASV